MIEAVNSVLQNASVVRASVEQTSTADSFVANPERVQKAAEAPFIGGPHIFIDVNFDRAVIQIHDSDTGDVVAQFPSQSSLEVQARQTASLAAQQSAPAPSPQAAETVSTGSVDSSGATVSGTTDVPTPTPTGGDTGAGAPDVSTTTNAATAQQLAAFAAAAQSGNTNSGNVTLLA